MRTMSSDRSRRRSRALAAVVAGAAALTTAACSSSTAGHGSSAAGRTLAIAAQGAPKSLDPAQLANGQQAYVWASIFDTLLSMDNHGKLQPNAARSWSYSADARTLTLKLRAGMTFSSGAPVNAAAVKATLDRDRATAGQSAAQLAAVSSVEAPDDLTVVIKLSHPDASLLDALAESAGAIGDPATMNQQRTALDPVGSGPYTLDTKATVAGSTYVLRRRDDYWNAKAYPFQTLTVKVIADPTAAFNALRAGQIDAGYVPAQVVGQLDKSQFTVVQVPASATGQLVLADRAGKVLKPLASPLVRQAINMAFDRQKIVKALLAGAGQPTVQVFNPAGHAYDSSLEQTYSYDTTKAKQLLAQAGYPNGFSVTMPSLYFSKSFEPTITQSLADIGIKVTWNPVPPQDTVSATLSQKYPMFFFMVGLDTDAIEMNNNFEASGHLNPFHTTDPTVTSLMSRINSELDPTKAADLYQQLNAYTVRQAWNAPIFYVGSAWATDKHVTYLAGGASTIPTVRNFGVAG